jgi:hypothetical protein
MQIHTGCLSLFQILFNDFLKSCAVSAFVAILDIGTPSYSFYTGHLPDFIASAFASLQGVPPS